MITSQIFYTNLRELTTSNQFCIAFSGGLDSTVLLHLFAQLRTIEPELMLRAVHVHHGLSQHANDWALFCENICKELQIPLTVQKVTITKDKESLEEIARQKRYAVFHQMLVEDEVLVTAHHQNDQAETLLLQLFRGAGPKGLASMPAITSFGKGFLIRPFLNVPREALQNFAETEKLEWLEDESNQIETFDRNFLRRTVFPLLQERWPAITENIARTARHCANADEFIQTHIKNIFDEVFQPKNKVLSIPLLLKYKKETQNYVIRYWLQKLRLPLPSTKKLLLLQNNMLRSRQDAVPLLTWKNVEIRRYDNSLYAMQPLSDHDSFLCIPWNLKEDIVLPNNLGVLDRGELERQGLRLNHLHNVTIRFRQGGERCRLNNRKHSHSLKKLFQEWRVPPWERDRIPLLYADGELRAVIGYAICEPRNSEKNLLK